MSSSGQLLPDIATLLVIDSTHEVDIRLERQGREIFRTFRNGVRESMKMVVVWCSGLEEIG